MINRSNLKNSRVAVIDADSLAFIVGWNHYQHDDVDMVLAHVDDYVHSILQAVQCRYYIGVLDSEDTEQQKKANFRHNIAKTKPYKGTRSEKPEWYQKWVKVIEDRLITEWGFVRVAHDMEADDVVCSLMFELSQIEFCTPICCGEDKDLNQIPGHHYNFKKNVGWHIPYDKAVRDFYYQVLMGDTSDNIPGLAGCGKVGAAAIVDNPELDAVNMHVGALYAYTNKLGVDAGIQSFYENYMLCKLRHDLDLTEYDLNSYDLEAHAIREMLYQHPKSSEDEAVDISGLFSVE